MNLSSLQWIKMEHKKMPEEVTLLPVREFPDRGAKWLLESPENTNCLLRIVDIELAECLDFKRLQLKQRFR